MFSATFPRSMGALARRILNKPLEVIVGGKSVVCDDVTQNVIAMSEEDKFLKLLELLGQFQEKGTEFSTFVITFRLLRIQTEYTDSICSLYSELYFDSIFLVGIPDIFEVMNENFIILNPEKEAFYARFSLSLLSFDRLLVRCSSKL